MCRRVLAALWVTGAGLSFCVRLMPANSTHAAVPPITSAVTASAVTKQPEVALTFDDGPSPYTPQILTILQRFHAHATFFVIGEYAALFAATLREALRESNEVGNHTFTHANLLGLSDGGVEGQLSSTQDAVRTVTGYAPAWFRPPYGSVDGRVSSIAASLRLRTVTWSVDTRDWSLPGVGAIAATAIAGLRPGSIIIMHDGGGNRSETVAALPSILSAVAARHLRAVTLSEMFGLQQAPVCHARSAHFRALFARLGIRARPGHPLYHAWAQQLCNGVNLGPATGRVYVASPGVRAQDFARTGHRILYYVQAHATRIQVIWPWAIGVFDAHGIQPHWGWAITRAWFQAYFRFQDYGPALGPPEMRGPVTIQRFQYGTAISRDGKVRWRGY
jgi:peptidoglycan/xylan/chitin deacetylase (PgdA/CDA1 family)